MLVLFRERAARALKHEIPNPPYQGGKATEATRRYKAYELRYSFIKAITEGYRTARYGAIEGRPRPTNPSGAEKKISMVCMCSRPASTYYTSA